MWGGGRDAARRGESDAERRLVAAPSDMVKTKAKLGFGTKGKKRNRKIKNPAAPRPSSSTAAVSDPDAMLESVIRKSSKMKLTAEKKLQPRGVAVAKRREKRKARKVKVAGTKRRERRKLM